MLQDIKVAIGDGEFLVLVGPSGCGKSTLLRMVAGLEDITGTRFPCGCMVVNDLSPKEPDVSFVLQNYSLYQHLSVAGNMGFSLILSGAPKAERDRRVMETARILGLSELLERMPKNLSGGQS